MLSEWHLQNFVRERCQNLRDEAEHARSLRESSPRLRKRFAKALIALAHRLEPRISELSDLSSNA
jgi:hypothetical protein